MSVSIQLMSGQTHSFAIFDGYRILNLRREISQRLVVDNDLLFIADDQLQETNDMDQVHNGELYHVFVQEPEPVEIITLRYNNGDFSLWRGDAFLLYVGFHANNDAIPLEIVDEVFQYLHEERYQIEMEHFGQEAYEAMRANIQEALRGMDEAIPDNNEEELYELFHHLFLQF